MSVSELSAAQRSSGLLLCVALLLCIGLVMVASASMDVTEAQFGHPFYFLLRHLLYVGAGAVAALFVYQIPIAFWQQHSRVLLIASGLLLTLVLIPHIGRRVNGSLRWIGVGPLTVQPSELFKICMIVYMAAFLERHEFVVRHRWGIFKAGAAFFAAALLLLLEPDFGTVMVLILTLAGLFWLSGTNVMSYAVLALAGMSAAGLGVTLATYRWHRMIAYTNPWAHPYDSGYQLIQSEIAYGRGGLFGVGLGHSVQKLFYLPEAHTDFVFAVLAEEFGLFGLTLVLALFVAVVLIGLRIGRVAELQGRLFAAYTAYGLALIIGIQALINMAVTAGALPTKGLPLPLVSYGGSSLVVELIMIALLLRVERESLQTVAVRP